jgi:NNP family nitrate/nitrite transporter-like MFS transporter
MTEKGKAISVLTLNTIAFTVCFAAWMMNGVLVTFLVDNGIYTWDKAQMAGYWAYRCLVERCFVCRSVF